MKKITVILALFTSIITFSQEFKDQGIWNDFHKLNLGKIVFSSEKIVHNAPNPSLQKKEFDLFDQIKGRIYIEKSLANWCNDLEKSGKYAQDEFNYSKFNSRIRLKGIITVDGVEQTDFMMDNLIEEAKKTEWTTWWYGFVSFKDSPYYQMTESTPENAFGKTIKKMNPGKHSVKITYYLLSLNIRYSSQIEIASGEFTLNVDANKKTEWLKLCDEEKLTYEESRSEPNSDLVVEETVNPNNQKIEESKYIEIKITNDVSGDFRFYYNGGQNYINSGGVRTFTCEFGQKFYLNTNGSQGKMFLEVTRDMNGKAFKTSELMR
jgi:hypothetical protein